MPERSEAKWVTDLPRASVRPLRYAELRKLIPKLSDKMLSQRLRDLTDAGLVSHTKSDGNKAEVYALAARAESLSRILGELYSWGDSNAAMFGVNVGRPLKMIEGPPVEPEPVFSHRATSTRIPRMKHKSVGGRCAIQLL